MVPGAHHVLYCLGFLWLFVTVIFHLVGIDACFSGREEEILNVLSLDKLSLQILEVPYHLLYKSKSFQFSTPVQAVRLLLA